MLALGFSGQNVYFHASTENGKAVYADSTPLHTSLRAQQGFNKGAPAEPATDDVYTRVAVAVPMGKSITLSLADLGLVLDPATVMKFSTIKLNSGVPGITIFAGSTQLSTGAFTPIAEVVASGLTINNETIENVSEQIFVLDVSPSAGAVNKLTLAIFSTEYPDGYDPTLAP